MRLKVITSACMIAAIIMAALWPAMLNSRPPASSSRSVRIGFARRFLAYNGTVIILLGGSGIGSLLIMKKTREEFREQSNLNMKLLVEQTLEDHRRKEGDVAPDFRES